ncbi:MAG: hypothetical protein KAI39_09875 [Desulfobulbaceae bacterium]|nr:hypothetical protein [Desulfobulbaceae bacterium]
MKQLTFRCSCCRRIVPRNPRARNQHYCGAKPCQQARKNKWQQNKQQMDSDHRKNKEESQCAWRQQNQDYWKLYREKNPAYCERNRQLQRKRDLKRKLKNLSVTDASDLAKKDASNVKSIETTGG